MDNVNVVKVVRIEDLYNTDLLAQKSLNIFLNRFQRLNSNFQEFSILGSPIISELAEAMATTSDRLRYFSEDNKEAWDLILENFGVVLLACINLDANGERFGRKSDEVKSYLQIKTLKKLATAEVISSVPNRELKETIYLCISGIMAEFLVDNFLETFGPRIQHPNNNLYQRILENTFVGKIENIHYLKFEEHRVSFIYFQRYLELDEYCQAEFWKWVSLKYFTGLNNPAYEFFKVYQDIVIDSGLPFRNVIRRRQAIEDKTYEKISNATSGRLYVISEELRDREFELRSYNNRTYKKANPDKPTVDNHHLFFPRSYYLSDKVLHKFINDKSNRVDINKNQHRNMNRFFSTGQMSHYKSPRLSRELMDQINRPRVIYDNDYKNFIGLQIAVLKVAQRFENEELGLLALDVYDLLRLQSRFVTPRTVKS